MKVIEVEVTVDVVDPLCNGDANGSATANASGGDEPYTYLWSDGQTTQTASGLVAGTYTVTVTDANGCSASETAILTDPTPVTVTATGTDPLCYEDSSAGTALAFDGINDYVALAGDIPTGNAYTMESWVQFHSTSDGVFLGKFNGGFLWMSAGDLRFEFRDAANTVWVGNPQDGGGGPFNPVIGQWYHVASTFGGDGTTMKIYVDGILVIETDPITTDPLITSEMMAIGRWGSVSDRHFEGLVDEVRIWNFSRTQSDILSTMNTELTGSEPGLIAYYNFNEGSGTTLNDLTGNGHAGTLFSMDPGTDWVPGPPALSVSGSGSATATGSGGTGLLTYTWSTGITGTSITGLSAGTYSVTVTDENGCTATDNITLVDPDPIVLTVTSTDPLCFGDANGTATASASGGTPGYTYLWSNGATTATATGLVAGTYSVTATDANGCTAIDNVTLVDPTPIVLTVTGTDLFCNGDASGTADATATGGTPGYTFLWSTGATTASITGLAAGTYTVTVTDANGCTAIDNVVISEPTPLVVSVETTETCEGVCEGTATAIVSGGTPGYLYLWAPSGETTSFIIDLCTGTYTVTVTDANGCEQSGSGTVTQYGTVNSTFSITK